jgi:hypothetical protein
MNRFQVMTGTAALMFALTAVAQHGHMGGGASGSHTMGHQPATHAKSGNTATHGQRTVDQKLTANTKLAGKISTLTGIPAQDACSGFKNLGQCVAAAHVSQNLGLKFVDLKDKMLALNPDGTPNTAAKPMSLGSAIQSLDPQANTKTEVKKAKQQAETDTESSS